MYQPIQRCAVVSRRSGVRIVGLGIGLLALAWSLPAYAIGPDYQTITPQDDSVVSVLINAVIGSGVGTFNGTGEIVANTMGADDNGFFEILTADHVVSTTGTMAGAVRPNLGIAFDNDPVTPPLAGASTFNDLNAVNVYRLGSTGTEDIAVMNVDYGTYNPAYNADVISLTPAYSLDDDTIVPEVSDFSDIGYGNQGNLVAGGYQAQGVYGVQRFLTDTISNIVPNFAGPGGYTYNSAQFTVKNPFNIAQAGTGTIFDGDSGSPMLSGDSVNTTVDVPESDYTDYDGPTAMSYYTDDEFAVATFGTITAGGFIAFGNTDGGVALDQADINWILLHGTEDYLPEPTALVLLPAAMLLALRRNRRAAA